VVQLNHKQAGTKEEVGRIGRRKRSLKIILLETDMKKKKKIEGKKKLSFNFLFFISVSNNIIYWPLIHVDAKLCLHRG
jgi:hypothetical protein